MIEWSISKSKLFQKCQRKWYYYTLVASGTSTDPVRKQAHQLKQLQSISAWRGSIVDHVIQQYLIPEIKRHNLPAQETVLSYQTSSLKDRSLLEDRKDILTLILVNLPAKISVLFST